MMVDSLYDSSLFVVQGKILTNLALLFSAREINLVPI